LADVTIIVPARNEEKNITRCLKSFPGYRVIVVNDGSTDRTVELAQAAGAEVIDAPPLQNRVMGKPNALAAGGQLATTTYILFVDADTWFHPGFVPSLVRHAAANQFILTSVFLKRHCQSIAEHMMLPYAFALYFCGVRARNVQNFLSKETLANGQCMLFNREAYEFFGGYRSVQLSVIEDVAIAEKVKRHRMKLQIMRAEHLGSVRMYDSMAAIWSGFRKNSFRFLRANPGSGWQVVLASILLTSILPVAFWLAKEEQYPFIAPLLAMPVLALWPWYGNPFRALLALPAIYLFQCIALHAMFSSLFGWTTDWKGRKV
jgi:glycosyltransferase involved in cell wall biosynthesis